MNSHRAIAALPTRPPLPPTEDARPWYRITQAMAISSPVLVRRPVVSASGIVSEWLPELLVGDVMAEADWLICWEGKPEHYMEPLNEAAVDMVSKHPELELYVDPLESLIASGSAENAVHAGTSAAAAPAADEKGPRGASKRKRRAKRRGSKRKARSATAPSVAAKEDPQ